MNRQNLSPELSEILQRRGQKIRPWHNGKKKSEQQAELDIDVRAYLAAGGSVTKVPAGISGQEIKPMRRTQKQLREDRRRFEMERALDKLAGVDPEDDL
jgi:hypothetical protein